nr:reverse transcriptase domain-containing protein [Tanacetum cinerariifolium]
MRTRSQSRNNFPQQEASPVIVEPLRIELSFLEDQFQEDPLEDPPEDSLNFAAGGNFLDKMPNECLKIIESKSKVRQSQAKAVIAKVSTSSSTPAISSEVAELKDMFRALLLDKKNQSSSPAPSTTSAPVKAVKPNCVTCGGAHSYQNYLATNGNVYRDNIQEYVSQAAAANYNQGNIRTLPSNTITNPKEDLKGITTRSGVAYQGPTIPTPSKVVKQGTEVTKDQVKTPSLQSTAPVQPPVVQPETQTPVYEPVVAPVSALMPNLKPSIPYPSRRDNQRRCDQANKQIKKFYEIFKDMSFEISFMDALIYMPKFASTLRALIGNKEKLSEMARTPMNEHCSAFCLENLEILANFLFLIVRSLNQSVSLKMSQLKLTGRALIDVHKGELTLRIGNEAITYNLDQTARYSANYNQMTENKIDVIDMACEEYSQEVLGFSDVTVSGNPTPYDNLIVSTTSPTLTPFRDSDFLLFEEADAFLDLEDDPNSPKINPFYYDLKGDILLLETILNSKPLLPLPNHEQYMPSFKKELKVCEAKTVKSSVDEPPEVELTDLPPHLEYAFLEGDNKLPVIIAKELGDEEKSALIKVEKLLDDGLIYPISDSPWVSPVHCVPKKGGFTVFKNEENELIPNRLVTGWRVCIDYRKLNVATRKDHFPLPFMDQMLERLAKNEYYCFHDGFSGYFQIPIVPRDQEKTTFTCPYGTFAYRRMPFGLRNAPGTFQRCMLAIFHDMVEKTMEVFMDDFSVFGNSFENCLSLLDKMLQRCEDTNLWLNWEKSHFMVKEGIFLGHKISKNGIKVDIAKVDVIAKLPHPTTVEGVRSFLGHAGFYRRFIQDFSKNFRPMTHLLEKKTSFIFSKDCIKAFHMLNKKLTEAPILIAPNWDLPFELMCGASDFAIGNVGRSVCIRKIPVISHHEQKHSAYGSFCPQVSLCQKGCQGEIAPVENPYENVLEPKEINKTFPLETLSMVTFRGDSNAPWFVDFDNYYAGNFIVKAYKTPIGCTPYKLVYGKACHLPIELEQKAYWALKQAIFDLAVAGDHRKESSSTSSFVTSLLNPIIDPCMESIFTTGSSFEMMEAVREAVQTQTEQLQDSIQRENDEFLRTIDNNMKKIIKEQMEGNKSIQRSDEQRNLYKALVDAYEADKTILDSYGESSILKRRREDDDDQEGPSSGSDRGSKRRREGGEHASASTPSEPATGSASRSTTGTQSRQLSASEAAFAEEPMQTTCQMEEPLHSPRRPPTPDRDWNKTLPATQGNAQSWISALAKQTNARSSFNELLDTPIDFSNFIMNRLGVDTLTPELLAGPTYELIRGSCNSLTELEYHLEEVYKVTTNQLDWDNPEGQQYLHNLLQPLPLIPDNRGRRVILFEHFINNDLKYLRGGALSCKYTTSVTKTKAADYGHIKWIEDLVPRTMWIQEPLNYDKHALWGVSHWRRKHQQFYGFAVNRESALDVYSKRRIIAVTDLKIVEWHNYKHLDWISVRRDDDKIYKLKEGDFKRLRLQDIEDMLLLLVQGKLSNLTVEERFAFNVSLRMFTRSIVIQQHVEDLQLGVESYQKRLNLTKPETYRSDLKRREAQHLSVSDSICIDLVSA